MSRNSRSTNREIRKSILIETLTKIQKTTEIPSQIKEAERAAGAPGLVNTFDRSINYTIISEDIFIFTQQKILAVDERKQEYVHS